jgi:hypothetical protein
MSDHKHQIPAGTLIITQERRGRIERWVLATITAGVVVSSISATAPAFLQSFLAPPEANIQSRIEFLSLSLQQAAIVLPQLDFNISIYERRCLLNVFKDPMHISLASCFDQEVDTIIRRIKGDLDDFWYILNKFHELKYLYRGHPLDAHTYVLTLGGPLWGPGRAGRFSGYELAHHRFEISELLHNVFLSANFLSFERSYFELPEVL